MQQLLSSSDSLILSSAGVKSKLVKEETQRTRLQTFFSFSKTFSPNPQDSAVSWKQFDFKGKKF
jgi:hypothetical protein